MKKIIKVCDGIILRCTQEQDLDFVINAERETENAKYVGKWSRDEHINSFSNKDMLHIIVQEESTSKNIGYIIMAGLNNPNNNVEFKRFVICEKDKGFGKKTLNLIKKYSFDELNAHRLWLDVRHKNYRAQNVYKSQGFKEEGILRDCILYNGEYESLVIMSILKNEYLSSVNIDMELKSQKLTEQQAKEVSSWKYSGEYEIYNLPSWDEMVRENYSLCDEIKRERFTAYLNKENELVGFVNLLDEGDSVFFGIGVNPTHCSKGIGKQITKLALDDCKSRFLGKPVILEVRTWNKRAIACYKSQGFEIIDTKIQETNLGVGEFYVMKYSK